MTTRTLLLWDELPPDGKVAFDREADWYTRRYFLWEREPDGYWRDVKRLHPSDAARFRAIRTA